MIELRQVMPIERKAMKKFVEENHSYVPNANMFGKHIDYWVVLDEKVVGEVSYKSGDLPIPQSIFTMIGVPFKNQAGEYYAWNFPIDSYLNNVRYTLLKDLPPNFASHVLAMSRKRVAADWRRKYGVPVLLFYTYIGGNHDGATYIADNWTCVGETKGRLTSSEARRRGIVFNTYRSDKKKDGRPQIFDPTLKKKIFMRAAIRSWRGETLKAMARHDSDQQTLIGPS